MSSAKKLMGTTAVGGGALAIEDVFSTYIFEGTGAAKTIVNGIDLAGEGGLVWQKSRSNAAYDHNLFDTERGVSSKLYTNDNTAAVTETDYLTSFNSDGFSIGSDAGYNESGGQIVTHSFRKAPRFFDIQTWTGDGTAGRQIPHNLGVVPGCIIVKTVSIGGAWYVYHRGAAADPETDFLMLNSTSPITDLNTAWSDTAPTDAVFTVGNNSNVNRSGHTHVAYLFAHDPLGPSGDGSDGLIACGNYTGNGLSDGPEIDLGWEPQWVLVKNTSVASDWIMIDNIRGWCATINVSQGQCASMFANLTNAEFLANYISIRERKFKPTTSNPTVNQNGNNYIYIAIRRGPMRQPETASEVFSPVAYNANNADSRFIDTGILTDAVFARTNNNTSELGVVVGHRLNQNYFIGTASTNAHATDADSFMTPTIGYGTPFSAMTGFGVGNDLTRRLNYSTMTQIAYALKRAPGFFDTVLYQGTGAAVQVINHGLKVPPEMIIIKNKSGVQNWAVRVNNDFYRYLNLTDGDGGSAFYTAHWADSDPTDSVFHVTSNDVVGGLNLQYSAFLFASLAGISKIGKYTGNGSSQTVDCGFTSGARFVLIKRADASGDWYVWDTARGIVAGNDPHLSLNSTLAEVSTDDSIDPDSSGFIVNQDAATNINVSSATYIYLAIA